MAYVLAVACDSRVNTTSVQRERVDRVAARTGMADPLGRDRAKGPRFYDWAWVHIHDQTEGRHSLLIRRGNGGQLAFCLCWTPGPVSLARLVTVAGSRWSIEEAFQTAKGHVGLDQYHIRRLINAALPAAATLTVAVAWSRWRRRHQAGAKQSLYKRRFEPAACA
ncbi:hypothetical protein [Catellatospora vulcania]|uniref:hypothetical protein n=1 Tax=Catellatospora vulcania TaxID=1460450 RepID=UPI001E5928BA|nr:hypothetical protein [Catellatospora vulcania]